VEVGYPGVRAWIKSLLKPARLPRTIFNALGIAGAALTALDLTSRVAAWAIKTEGGRFQWYLWISFVIVAGMPVLWLVLYSTVRHDLRKSWERVELGKRASRIQHEMSEAVRRCAADPRTYNVGEDLNRVMSILLEYLRMRLGDAPYAITVKRIEPGRGRLVRVFRDGGQRLDRRSKGDDVSFEDSPVYMRFLKASPEKRVTFIGDTDQVPILEDSFRDRARACGYRTVIGFPLRLPVELEPAIDSGPAHDVKFANLLGFFSIDAPHVGAFEGLLLPPGRGTVNRDDDREPRNDLDIFYGLADSVATILMLTSPVGAMGKGEIDEQRHHRHG